MDLSVAYYGNIAVVTLPGEHLDASNVKAFKQEIKPVLDEFNQVLFDLSQLQFVDSSGIGAILSCLRTLDASNGDLKLCGVTKSVRTIFQLVRMHRVFEIFNTKEEALRAFQTMEKVV